MERRVARRYLLGTMAASVAAFMAACGGDIHNSETKAVDDPALGRVYQWEKDDLLLLISDLQPSYHAGDDVRFHLLLNNQSSAPAQVRIRTKLLGRGQQAVAEAEVVAANVPSADAVKLERDLRLPRGLPPGDYTLQVELPPWTLPGQQTVGGGSALVPLRIVS